MSEITWIDIEPTTRCNFACVYCLGRHMVQKDIPLDHVEEALRLLPTVGKVSFNGEGETMLHPKWDEMVRSARAKGKRVSFLTNGSLLNQQNRERILEIPLDELRVSIDSTDPAEFRAIRGGDLARIIESVRQLVVERDRLGLRVPAVGLNVTVLRTTRSRLRRVFELYGELGLDGPVFVQTLQTKGEYAARYGSALDDEALTASESEDLQRDFGLLAHEFRVGQARFARVRALGRLKAAFTWTRRVWKRRSGCPWLERGAYLRASGSFTPCCLVKDYSIGEIGSVSLEQLVAARRALNDELLRGSIPMPCAGCGIAAAIVGQSPAWAGFAAW